MKFLLSITGLVTLSLVSAAPAYASTVRKMKPVGYNLASPFSFDSSIKVHLLRP
jgi:hypothetical protein